MSEATESYIRVDDRMKKRVNAEREKEEDAAAELVNPFNLADRRRWCQCSIKSRRFRHPNAPYLALCEGEMPNDE